MKVFVKTFGCAYNKRDSENIRGVLKNSDYELVDSSEEADIVIVNSCGVKSQTQSKIIVYIESQNKPVYLGGCLPKMLDLTNVKNVKGVFDTNSITKLPEQISKEIKENFSDAKENRLNIPIVREKEETLIVPISQGCLGNCHYCSTKFARGTLKSYPIEEIIKEIRNNKASLVHLTSQDNGCYGFDIKTNLIELLRKVLEIGDFKIKLGMINPQHVLKFLPELIEIYKNERILKILHIPIQSASNKVLKEMNRYYTVEDFKRIVSEFRKEVPEIHILTDVIVGYPTETEEDFLETKDLLEELKLNVVNLSKFTARPKTFATKNLKPLTSEEVKRRCLVIAKII
jgi:threonylcarbamoyladenosine tRNA methylthiotransferase CDKAL1